MGEPVTSGIVFKDRVRTRPFLSGLEAAAAAAAAALFNSLTVSFFRIKMSKKSIIISRMLKNDQPSNSPM